MRAPASRWFLHLWNKLACSGAKAHGQVKSNIIGVFWNRCKKLTDHLELFLYRPGIFMKQINLGEQLSGSLLQVALHVFLHAKLWAHKNITCLYNVDWRLDSRYQSFTAWRGLALSRALALAVARARLITSPQDRVTGGWPCLNLIDWVWGHVIMSLWGHVTMTSPVTCKPCPPFPAHWTRWACMLVNVV